MSETVGPSNNKTAIRCSEPYKGDSSLSIFIFIIKSYTKYSKKHKNIEHKNIERKYKDKYATPVTKIQLQCNYEPAAKNVII